MFCKFKRNIESFDVDIIDDKFSICIDTAKRRISYSFENAIDCQMWINALKGSIEVEQEIKRTISGFIKYNAALLYSYYQEKREKDIKKMIKIVIEPINTNLKPPEFNNALKLVSKEMNLFLDAFYARKPFSIDLFKYIAVQFHSPLRSTIYNFWNKNKSDMNAGDIIAFMNAISLYDRSLQTWGIEDSKFNGWVDPLLKSFIEKLFGNCKTILANILYDQRNKFYLEKNKIVSRASDGLESHLNFIFDHYNQVPSLDAAELLLSLCTTILQIFLMNTKQFIRTDAFPLQIYMAHENNSFLKVIKNFQRRVSTLTKNQLPLREIKAKMDEEYLIHMISEIEKMSYKKISGYIRQQVDDKFSDCVDLMTMDLTANLDSIVEDCMKIIEMVDNRFTASDLIFDIFDQVTILYYKMFLEFAPKVSSNNLEDFKSKIKNDIEIIANALEPHDLDKGDEVHFKMQQLYTFAITEDLDQALVSLINMNVLYPKIIEYSNIDKLIRIKGYFSKKSKEYITTYLKTSLDEFKTRQSVKNNIGRSLSIKFKVKKFIKILSNLIRNCSRNTAHEG